MLVNPINVKYHSLTGRITPQLVREAFHHVKRNRGAAGIDKQRIQMFEANLEQNLDALLRELKKIKELTKRSYNLDNDRIARVNQVIRGTANYFATSFTRRLGETASVALSLGHRLGIA